MLETADEILENLLKVAKSECDKAVAKNYITKDFVESCGILISLVYGRYGKND